MCNLICTNPKSNIIYLIFMKYRKIEDEIISSDYDDNTNGMFEDTYNSVIAKLLEIRCVNEENALTRESKEGRQA